MTGKNGHLRILLVIEPGSGGSVRHVLDLAAGLLARGHHVEIVYSRSRAEEWYLTELAELGAANLHCLEMERELGLHDIKAARQLRRLISTSEPFDIIHGHSSKAGALVRLAGWGLPGKKVYTPHALITLAPDLGSSKRLVYTVAEKVLDLFADAIICVSDEERDHARSIGLSAKKLVTVENGLAELPPPDRVRARQQLGIRDSDVCLGFVGRLSSQKSVDRLIRAFGKIYAEAPSLVLAIIGDGPDMEELQELARRLGLGERVRFTGLADGVFLMSGFDVFVLPSRYEAFPYVYLEALARELPIISTDVGGARAVIDDGVNGYVIPQAELEMLASRMSELGADAELRKQMSKASYEKSLSKTAAIMVDRTLDVYRQILSK